VDSSFEERMSDGNNGEKSPLLKVGVVGALGFEFVGLVIGSFLIGSMIDERFDVGPWGTVGMLALGMLAGAWHVYLIAKKYLIEE
jgi:F0F1-type ATP synthase assembly protein I